MKNNRVKINSIIENQLPQFVREEFPLVSEFLSQYYISLETQSGSTDILQNIDEYVKVDNLTNLIDSTILTFDVTFFDSTIQVQSTKGFPESYGLLLIDSEIITYTSKTTTTFEGCIRGFNGVTSYREKKDELIFSETESEEHTILTQGNPTKVINLSILFLKEFLIKIKKQFTPGFEDRKLYSDLNENIFIKQSIDFYSSKGTDNSFKILFGALYGEEEIEVIKPRDYLIQPSDAQYRITADLVVETIEGDPLKLINKTLYQDKGDFIDAAQGTITKVERIRRNSKDYYTVSLDYDYNKDIQPTGTVYGNFTIHPKTKLISSVNINSTTLEVDSTVGFPNKNGILIINLENGNTLSVSYQSKTLNQFLDCSGISEQILESTEIKLDVFAYGYNLDEIVKIRILGVLSELKIPEDTYLYSKDDKIKIKTLGANLTDVKSNNWFFNIPTKYEVESIEVLDLSDKTYRVKTYNNHSFRVGDSATFISNSSSNQTARVISFNNEKSFTVIFGSEIEVLDLNTTYIVKKEISKLSVLNYPLVNKYTSNIQNVYSDNNSLYVASPSLPNYQGLNLNINDRSVIFSGVFGTENTETEIFDLGPNPHGFYTGDSVVYKPSKNDTLGLSTGTYFVKRESNTKIKLARSRNNIFTQNFIKVKGSVLNSKIELSDFTYRNLETQVLESQKLIRKISNPQNDNNVYETSPGMTGIFINGVELLNYKSRDNIYYGPIQSIIPTSSGSDYDIINPPILTIKDSIGSGANGYCSVIGGLERINIIDSGFDYLETPNIDITGGNGEGAIAEANLISFDHTVEFNSQNPVGVVSLTPINLIKFSKYHKFRDNEEVIYITNGQSSVGGLSTNSTYFVSVEDEYTIKLYKSALDASIGINTIPLTSYGIGNHLFKCKNKKKKLGSISIKNSGKNYQNKLTSTTAIGINTASDIITIPNHGYQSGEILTYHATQSPVGGLSSASSYYATKINDNQFKLSQIGSSGITTSFYYDSKQFINLTSIGSGIHKFNYPEIKVSIKGRIGVSTFSGQNFNAIIQPIFRGNIQSVFVESGGTKYGSEEIINYNRQPSFELSSGSGIQLSPVILNGKIVDVLINSIGSGYNSPPNIIVRGTGTGAVLTPVLSNGSLIDVKVINSGIGYRSESTFIEVISSGFGSKFEAQIKPWKINLVERLIQNSQISDDDGILSNGLNTDYGLEYSHAYSPRYLRSLVQGTSFKDGKVQYTQDLQLLDKKEINSSSHSPIVGWSYDGNPIYGPYGYSSKNGGVVKSLTSGYKLNLKENRPSTLIYPQGFFIDDYSYTNDGDLDQHNGRFCVTPEYPNGVYAYFMTISNDLASDGPFINYKKPTFPYVIGTSYKSKPIDFNFDRFSNQDSIDINSTSWKRNTTPYNILNEKNSYEYLLNPNTIRKQNSVVKSTFDGTVDSVGVITGGNNYAIGDEIIFNNSSGYGAKAKVSLVAGKNVSQISASSSVFNDVKFYPYNQEFIGFTSIPHNYSNNDIITFTGKYDYKKTGNITVSTNTLSLTSGIGSASYTGLVTYFNISGNLSFPNIRENDLYQIGNEVIKVLNIDQNSSRIRVIRNQNNTIGLSTYSSGTLLLEKTRKFKLDFGISTTYNFDLDREIYFDPRESVGLGTIFGVGIVSTLNFSNPGAGDTQIVIPTKSIYIKNHNLNTGDSIVYSTNGGTSIGFSTDGISSFSLNDNSIVYATKISSDLVGISTIKIGLGSTGNFVSVGSTIQGNLLYFTSIGSGNYHSFKTNYTSSLVGKVSKNVVTVSTAETHGLSLYDTVDINVKSGISTTIIVKYNDYNRRIVFNPKSFSSIDIANNLIQILNHGYYSGQKVIFTSNNPPPELQNEGIYYIIAIDSNSIKLSNSYYDSVNYTQNSIGITSSTSGTISEINPFIEVLNDQIVTFDLSDSSLSFINNSVAYSAFDFKLFKDNSFKEEFDKTETSPTFEVVRTGRVGIDSTAKITLSINENVPKTLYYNLIPVNLDLNTKIKKEIIVDTEVLGSNKINIVESKYNGKYLITGISSNSFSYNIIDVPEINSYSNNIEYYTNSKSTSGSIQKIFMLNGGKYSSLPNISSINSRSGYGAILQSKTKSIGRIKKTEIEDIGFDYNSDYSVRPTVKLPEILILESLSSLDYIGITSFGRNYTSTPSLIVIDGLTNKVIEDIKLNYSFGDSQVTILKNNSEINNITPKIIPINNSNGIKIKNISFNETSKNVIVSLASSFSSLSDFPFFIGDKVLIEGVSVGVSTFGKGYNSSNYDYSLFTITEINPGIGGGISSITYNLSSYLKNGETPGTFNANYSSGKVISESYFPIFNPVLKSGTFYKGEIISNSSNSTIGNVESWDPNNRYLKVSTLGDFEINQSVKGKTSGSTGIIKEIINFESEYKVNSFSEKRKGWNNEVGFLNNDFQRLHDSDYYQYFSYAIKSKVDFETWDNPVSTLNHTAGFKKFGNLIIESFPVISGISTDQDNGDFTSISDLVGFVNLNCVFDFDLAKENLLSIDNSIKSDQIIFNSKIIQDYIESIGNRVLIIDDISDKFNSNPRSTEFSIVDSFPINKFRSKKYISCIVDKKNPYDRQVSIVSLIKDNQTAFLNQYGLNPFNFLGFFDFSISGNTANLLFYPSKPKFNDYYVELFSFSLNDNITGIGTVSLGDSIVIGTSTTTILQGTSSPTTILGISSNYTSSKILVQIGATDSSYYEYNEITYIHNKNNVYVSDYGRITTNTTSSKSSLGIGTYDAYISGSNVVIELIPNESTTIDYNVNIVRVSIADTNSSGIGTQVLQGSKLQSFSSSISSSTSPVANVISSYSNLEHGCSYSLVKIEDKTNLNYQVSEVLISSDLNDSYITEFGSIQTNSSLGIITTGLSGSNVITYFTPLQNIDVDVKVFQVSVGLNENSSEISLNNGSLNYNYGDYTGTNNDVRKSFDLTYENAPIFKKYFDASDSAIVNIQANTIRIPNHFYVTGEEVLYSYLGEQSSQPIGIHTTFISGIGNTDKLPLLLYIVKVDDLDVQVAASASDALKTIPSVLDLTSLGIGNSHSFTSKKQNEKVIISIDNFLQSPIVSTSVTSSLSKNIGVFDSEIYAVGINSIYSGDLIRINDEVMKVSSVGVGSTNSISVIRPWLGTLVSTHTSSSLITKVYGNYNIVDNTIYFSDAPYGKVPILNQSNRPDEIDYSGIITSSSFSGRVFLRSGVVDTNQETYYSNYIFDDISDQFDGSRKTFTLKSKGSNVTGISSDNSVLLINDVFQTPNSLVASLDYDLSESLGITSVTFTGIARSTGYDVNTASIPRGGIIISVGSSQGFGYQPLVAAGGTAVVSSSGTIQSISIGNSGSGYRSGIQKNVRVGVKTESVGTPNIEFVGVASVSNGNVVSVAITNPGIGYTNYSILKNTVVSSNISSGSTIIPLSNISGVSSGNYISVGTALTNVYIVGIGSTSITIGTSNTSPFSISSGTPATIKHYNPPIVVFDSPLSYSNIPLIYASGSSSGSGSGAVIDIIVGQGSSVISFELKNLGYGYKQNEKLTVSIGGTIGIPTNSSSSFSEFQILIDKVHSDKFSSWTIGNLQVIDSLDSLFDGSRKVFPIRINENQITIRSKKGSNIDIQATLLVFINDVLQIPGKGYIFEGGSTIRFNEAPKEGDKSRILFYKGTGDVDTKTVDILENIKVGDKVTLKSDDINFSQDERLVTDIISSDVLNTNLYSGPGVSNDENFVRPVVWCRQTEDAIINGQEIGKNRILYEPYIQPSTNIIQNVGISSNIIFVESLKAFFDSEKEYLHNGSTETPQNKIIIISQNLLTTAIATPIVSISGSISSFNIIENGVGYTTSPIVSISNPIGIGTSGKAKVSAIITNGSVSSIQIIDGGFGYSSSNLPSVLFESPPINYEIFDRVSYEGDFGVITGINTISVGVASTGIVFDFFIPQNSVLRDKTIVKSGVTTAGISGIQTGYYFTVKNSNIGNGIISLNSNNNIVGIGTSFVDNVYQVASVSVAQTSVPGVGITNVTKVIVSVSNYNNLIGFGFSGFYGEYSWGKITTASRQNPKQFISYANVGGISTSPIVQRFNRLKYSGYSIT